MGFAGDVGDVGDLARLADCLGAVLVLAERYEMDLEAAYVATVDELAARLDDSSTD